MIFVSEFGNTRAGAAIKAGAVVRRICGVSTVRIDPVKAMADGQCCGLPYATEYVSSAGASVHVWFGASFDETKLEKAVRTLLYWKDVRVLTWSRGEPLGYQNHYRLELKEDRREAANEQDLNQASGF